jgi:hypothetical protein
VKNGNSLLLINNNSEGAFYVEKLYIFRNEEETLLKMKKSHP